MKRNLIPNIKPEQLPPIEPYLLIPYFYIGTFICMIPKSVICKCWTYVSQIVMSKVFLEKYVVLRTWNAFRGSFLVPADIQKCTNWIVISNIKLISLLIFMIWTSDCLIQILFNCEISGYFRSLVTVCLRLYFKIC